ncbi:MAG: DHA2 family efflux MFS transporter permease subunit [Solirubrobacteraceae bacterium]
MTEPRGRVTTADEADRLVPGTLTALLAMGLAVFAIAIDSTALSVALPRIESDFKVDVSVVQWVINAYGLVFGVLIVAGGRLADMFGRRRMFMLGAALFAAFSLLGGVAPSAGWLIAARALMGVGAALMWPATLGMTFTLLPASKAGLAGGLVLGVAGIGNALGPMIGGALTDAASWRWVLFLNLPIALIACAVTWTKVHQPHDRTVRERIDYAGIATLCAGSFALLVALDQATNLGFGDGRVIVLIVASVVLLGSFPLIELRMRGHALIPPDVARNQQFAAACVAISLLAAGFFASLLYLPQFMQKLLGYSPLGAGVGLLPMMLVYGSVSFLAGTLYGPLGAKLITSAGAAGMAIGLLLLSLVTSGSGYGAIIAGMVVFGAGLGLFISSVTTAAITTVDPSRASLAGGLLHMLQLTGGSIGLGLSTAIFTSAFHTTAHNARLAGTLTAPQEHAVNGILAGTASTQQLAQRFPRVADALDRLSREAFASGMHASFRVTAALAAVGFLVAVGFIGGRIRRRREPATPEMATDARLG